MCILSRKGWWCIYFYEIKPMWIRSKIYWNNLKDLSIDYTYKRSNLNFYIQTINNELIDTKMSPRSVNYCHMSRSRNLKIQYANPPIFVPWSFSIIVFEMILILPHLINIQPCIIVYTRAKKLSRYTNIFYENKQIIRHRSMMSRMLITKDII